jgi:hypothetical protein
MAVRSIAGDDRPSERKILIDVATRETTDFIAMDFSKGRRQNQALDARG